ncbi:hypothetical protein EDB81DRAFT_888110 [Dactylonectria macrodidyma]|uniref:Uncharacterized protein n=1 Tax=Dactylonectria macrodidyma TaxID=307937 RepID=A0A9P9E5T7_9HYPO|nr:hypothetical protein EDB81DRAFT_888110 [Dactylonectria macrodidyma]
MGGGPAVVAEAPPDPGPEDHADHANSTDDTTVSEDAHAALPKETTGLVWSKKSAGSHGATPDTEKCDKASLQSSQSGDDVAKDNNSPEYNETGDKEDRNTENNICCCWPEEVKVVELSSVVGEPPMEAARDVGATTTTTHDAGATDEPSNSAANLPEPCGGVTQLTHAAVAAVQKWPCKSTEAQGEDGDGDGKKEAGDEDDENSDGWTELGRLPDLLRE